MQVRQLPFCDFRDVRKGGPDEVRHLGFDAGIGQVAALLDFMGERGLFPVLFGSQNNEVGTFMRERSTFVTPNTASDPVMAVKIDSLLLRSAYGS
jgi:hypothetical protein